MSIIYDYREPKKPAGLDEGSQCPDCHTGVLGFWPEDCRCHICAPCASCTEALLKCAMCKAKFEVGETA